MTRNKTSFLDLLGVANVLSIANLVAGVLGVVALIRGDGNAFLTFFIASLILDSLDGWYARRTHTESVLGFYLDSVADTISFGVLVGVYLNLVVFEQSISGWVFSGIYMVANLIRHSLIVKPNSPKVYGVPNLVAALLIVSAHVSGLIPHSLILFWQVLTLGLSLLMVIPIEFLNHKLFKNRLLVGKAIGGGVLLLPGLLLMDSLQFLWGAVCVLSSGYIVYGCSRWMALARSLSIVAQPEAEKIKTPTS